MVPVVIRARRRKRLSLVIAAIATAGRGGRPARQEHRAPTKPKN